MPDMSDCSNVFILKLYVKVASDNKPTVCIVSKLQKIKYF